MAIYVLLAVVGIGVIAGLRYWWTSRQRDALAHAPPPLFYPLPSTLSQAQPMPPPMQSHLQQHLHPPVNGNGAAHPAADAPVIRQVAVEPARTAPRRPMPQHDDEHDPSETVRFVRPTDVSVQLLPGRLEVLEGKTPHREIRFVRIPGEPVHVILGRETGLTPHYIGLESPTVSRRHARFDFADNRWLVKNLSRTNPLVINDDELFDTDVARPLADGDRLELGEVVLRFHAQ